MLGYIRSTGRGDDDLLRDVAERLMAEGIALAGAVQENQALAGKPCSQMDLRLLAGTAPDATPIRISQRLGAEASGCRLDPDGLARAVGWIANDLDHNAGARALVIINKFGRQEAEGGGFRPVIAQALAADLPVLTKISRDAEPAFLEFVGDLAQPLPADAEALYRWCRSAITTRD